MTAITYVRTATEAAMAISEMTDRRLELQIPHNVVTSVFINRVRSYLYQRGTSVKMSRADTERNHRIVVTK